MIDFQDEVLGGEARYRMVDRAGNVVHDDVAIELITEVLKTGTPLNKILFDKIKSHLVPSGLISMWSGTVVPDGWYLCNGENGTPDLRNRFIVGAGDEYSIGDIGGEKEHFLTIDEMPAHTHSYQKVGSKGGTAQTSSASHYYENTSSSNTGSAGGNQAHENRPPYYALAFIMKV